MTSAVRYRSSGAVKTWFLLSNRTWRASLTVHS